jgi:hypothetical protein
MIIDRRLIEDEANSATYMTDEQRVAYSMAISLKKISDTLANGGLFTQPVNAYGESFTDAIQMAFVRGQRGIDII